MPRKAAAKPVKTRVAAATAGYSGTPLPKKLGVDGERSVMLLNAPKGFEAAIYDGASQHQIKRGDIYQSDVVIWFLKSKTE